MAEDGTEGTVSLDSGNSLRFEPETLTITVPESNPVPVVVIFAGVELSIEPGRVASLLPRDIKARLLEDLSVFSDESKRFRKAIKEIAKSLDGRLWSNGSHLDPKQGHKVFDRERKAVRELMHLLEKPKKLSVDVLAAAEKTMADLVTADRILATIAIDEAKEAQVTEPKRQKKVDKELAKAQSELAKGESAEASGEIDKAIKRYEKAWNHSIKAAKKAAKKPGEADEQEDKDDDDEVDEAGHGDEGDDDDDDEGDDDDDDEGDDDD